MLRKLLCCSLTCLLALPYASAAPATKLVWPLWDAYLQRFMQTDGRVIDQSCGPESTTSEAQAYTLFFALLANDRARFALLLDWTQNNLAAGNLASQLPAWCWGSAPNGRWRVLDNNPAADANMWLAYTLLQAGSLWQEPGYTKLGQVLLAHIKAQEVVMLPGLGPMLLPGPSGFALEGEAWRINLSYLAPQHLRAFARADRTGPWQRMAQNLPAVLRATSPHGFAPDWVTYQAKRGWITDTRSSGIGSYDAIRLYLWVGMLSDADADKPVLLKALAGMRKYLRSDPHGGPMEKVDVNSGVATGKGPPGFAAALLPYLGSLPEPGLLSVQMAVLAAEKNGPLLGVPPVYYDQILGLFGTGFIEQRFEFDRHGQLIPMWKKFASAPDGP